MKRLYFMRHGESEMNVLGLISSVTDTPLTPEGHAQAKKAGVDAKDLELDCIVSSPLQRAYDTAKIIAEEIGLPIDHIKTNDLLTERDFGELEGTRFGAKVDRKELKQYEQDDELVQRARQALGWINQLPADNILVVSHGAFGRALRSIIRDDYPMSHPHRMGNAEIFVLR